MSFNGLEYARGYWAGLGGGEEPPAIRKIDGMSGWFHGQSDRFNNTNTYFQYVEAREKDELLTTRRSIPIVVAVLTLIAAIAMAIFAAPFTATASLAGLAAYFLVMGLCGLTSIAITIAAAATRCFGLI